MKLVKYLYTYIALFVFIFAFFSLLMSMFFDEGVYLHTNITKYYWPIGIVFILTSAIYFFLKILLNLQTVMLKVIFTMLFLSAFIFLIGLLTFMFIFDYPDPKIVSINGKEYIVEKEMINPHRWKYNFYEEINWYSMKAVNKEENEILSREYFFNKHVLD